MSNAGIQQLTSLPQTGKHKRSRVSMSPRSNEEKEEDMSIPALSIGDVPSNQLEVDSDTNSHPPSPPRIFSPTRPAAKTPFRVWLSENTDSPTTIQKKMTHRLKFADAAREQALKERMGKARADEAARVSRSTFHSLEKQRERVTARSQIEQSLTEAQKRRNSWLKKRREEAKKHLQEVKQVASRVRAAKGVQRWWRFTVEKWRSRQGKGVRRRIAAENDSSLLSAWLEHAEDASALELLGLGRIEERTGKDALLNKESIREILDKAHSQSNSKRFREDVSALLTAAETIKEAGEEGSFEKAALALQDAKLVSIAQRFSKAISVWSTAARKEILKAVSKSADDADLVMQTITPKQVSPSSFPLFAR